MFLSNRAIKTDLHWYRDQLKNPALFKEDVSRLSQDYMELQTKLHVAFMP